MKSIPIESLGALKKVLAVNLEKTDVPVQKEMDIDLTACQDTVENILEVLKGCRLP